MPPRDVRDTIFLGVALLLFAWSFVTMLKARVGVRGLVRPIPLLMITLSTVYIIDHAVYGDLNWRNLFLPLLGLSGAIAQAAGGPPNDRMQRTSGAAQAMIAARS